MGLFSIKGRTSHDGNHKIRELLQKLEQAGAQVSFEDGVGGMSMRKEFEGPLLVIVRGSPQMEDDDGSHAIEAVNKDAVMSDAVPQREDVPLSADAGFDVHQEHDEQDPIFNNLSFIHERCKALIHEKRYLVDENVQLKKELETLQGAPEANRTSWQSTDVDQSRDPERETNENLEMRLREKQSECDQALQELERYRDTNGKLETTLSGLKTLLANTKEEKQRHEQARLLEVESLTQQVRQKQEEVDHLQDSTSHLQEQLKRYHQKAKEDSIRLNELTKLGVSHKDMLFFSGLVSPPFDAEQIKSALWSLKTTVDEFITATFFPRRPTGKQMWGPGSTRGHAAPSKDLLPNPLEFAKGVFQEHDQLRVCEDGVYTEKTAKVLLTHLVLRALSTTVLSPCRVLAVSEDGRGGPNIPLGEALLPVRLICELWVQMDEYPDHHCYNRALHIINWTAQRSYDKLQKYPSTNAIKSRTAPDHIHTELSYMYDKVFSSLCSRLPDSYIEAVERTNNLLLACVEAALKCQLLLLGTNPCLEFQVSGYPDKFMAPEDGSHRETYDLGDDTRYNKREVVFCSCPGLVFVGNARGQAMQLSIPEGSHNSDTTKVIHREEVTVLYA